VKLNAMDWMIVAVFLAAALALGVAVAKRAGSSSAEFFLSGRHMPWWLLGVSMVATTFSAGTPNLVTDIVRQNGVAGNWLWWSFLLTGMMTVFIYAKLWRRSGVMTDVEFYELRYSGKPAAFLRGFRALYLGVLFNVINIATATLAAIKIAGVMLGASPYATIIATGAVTLVYCMLGGLTGVLLTDFLLFLVAMGGAVAAAVFLVNLDAVGGLSGLLAHEVVRTKLSMLPDFHDMDQAVAVFIIPVAVQWWSVWYPGSEPGGGGYIAQRMLAAKDERHATGATLLFNVAHYALRPWPWILVALCSLVVFPDLPSLQAAFPHVDSGVMRHDLAYPAMMTLLPGGLRGLILASLMAAHMSTLSTLLNLGSSYVVNDFYRRFARPDAGERELVFVGRLAMLLTMVLGSALGLCLNNAAQAFHLILQIGAGTGLLFILRWFWWRINALSELAAMIVSFAVAVYFEFFCHADVADWKRLVVGVAVTTASWTLVALVTRPTDEATLRRFCRLIKPGGPGWRAVVQQARAAGDDVESSEEGWSVPIGIIAMVLGCASVYSALFAAGYWIYREWLPAAVLTCLAAFCGVALTALWSRVNAS
jgi:SSS family solute:Na+ symporter